MWVLAAAAAIQGVSMIMDNQAKAGAARKQADFFREQAENSWIAHQRKMELLEVGQKQFSAKQAGMFAKAGVSLAGSALEMYSQSLTAQQEERAAVELQGRLEYDSIIKTGMGFSDAAAEYGSPTRTLLSLGGIGLNMGAQYQSAKLANQSSKK